jgi:hypothetical protein
MEKKLILLAKTCKTESERIGSCIPGKLKQKTNRNDYINNLTK